MFAFGSDSDPSWDQNNQMVLPHDAEVLAHDEVGNPVAREVARTCDRRPELGEEVFRNDVVQLTGGFP